MIESGLICWSSKKQEALAFSSAKVEYQGAMNATIQVVWLHGILIEFEIHTSSAIDLYCDNQSIINISTDHVQKQGQRP